jgi:hypothetical protein
MKREGWAEGMVGKGSWIGEKDDGGGERSLLLLWPEEELVGCWDGGGDEL